MTAAAVTALIDFAQPQGAAGERLRYAFGAPLRLLQADTLAEVKPLLEQAQAQGLAGRWCLGHVAYEAAPAFDAALRVHPATGPLARFAVFDAALPWPEDELLPSGAAAAVQQPVKIRWDSGPRARGLHARHRGDPSRDRRRRLLPDQPHGPARGPAAAGQSARAVRGLAPGPAGRLFGLPRYGRASCCRSRPSCSSTGTARSCWCAR